MEKWRWVIGYERQYQVSSEGRVRSVDRYVRMESHAWNKTGIRFHAGRMLTPHCDKRGYLMVTLTKSGEKTKAIRIHREVLRSFKGAKPAPDMDCCHNDGDRANNRLSNLRYDTRVNNQLDRRKHGTDHYNQGEECATAVLTEYDVLRIRKGIRNFTNGCLADIYGVSPSTISDITHRRTWKHIK